MQGYELIGATYHSDIVEAALEIYLRRGASRSYAALEDAFRDLDSPRPLKLDYIRAHAQEFGG